MQVATFKEMYTMWCSVKNLPANTGDEETPVWSLSWEDIME